MWGFIKEKVKNANEREIFTLPLLLWKYQQSLSRESFWLVEPKLDCGKRRSTMLGNKDESPTDIPETEPEPGGTPVDI